MSVIVEIKNNNFESTMKSLGVTPLSSTGKFEHSPSKPSPSNERSIADEARVLEDSMSENPDHSNIQWESDEELCKPGLATRDYIRLKKGKFHRENETNIRGYSSAEANKILEKFLRDSINSGHRCVKIIHGKGMNSPDGISVIKLNTQKSLALNKFVLAYCKAQPSDGGSGAKYVLLKKKR